MKLRITYLPKYIQLSMKTLTSTSSLTLKKSTLSSSKKTSEPNLTLPMKKKGKATTQRIPFNHSTPPLLPNKKTSKKILAPLNNFSNETLEYTQALEIAETALHELAPSEKTTIMIYMHEIGKTELLTSSQEMSLAKRVKKGDSEARQLMIQANLRLVVKIAHDYSSFGLPLMDLISEGNLGLIKAVERFDPDKGGKLSTYASWWIRQSMKRALANQGKTIRLPVHLIDKIALIRKATIKLQEELQREPSNEEISQETGFSVNKVAHLKSVSIRPTSLDVKVGEEENTTLSDLVGDENMLSPYEDLHSKNLTKDLTNIISTLSEREAEIIKLRFGLDDKPPITLEEAGTYFGITRERVRQLQNIALRKIRNELISRERLKTTQELEEENEANNKIHILKQLLKSPYEV